MLSRREALKQSLAAIGVSAVSVVSVPAVNGKPILVFRMTEPLPVAVNELISKQLSSWAAEIGVNFLVIPHCMELSHHDQA